MFEIGCTEVIICRLRLPAVSAGQIGRHMRILLWFGPVHRMMMPCLVIMTGAA
jgi:hypothetical protein